MSWYKSMKDYSPSEEGYLKMISEGFMMRSAMGEPIPYRMTAYQREFHAASLNIKREKAADILFVKARGISFTYSSLVELIITAATYNVDLIPIITQRFSNAKKILNVAKWLVKNCRLKEIRMGVVVKQQSIEFTKTGCIIEPYPSADAANAIRGMRLIRGLLDEFAFQLNDEDLWAAAQDCIQGDFGQWLIGSTPCGMDNFYFKMVQDARKGLGNWQLFDLPVFDPKKFNPKMSILEQPALEPIAPWISLKKLEEKRRRDWRIFMQENMCDFLDDSTAWIAYRKIMNCIVDEDENGKPARKNHRDTIFRRGVYHTENPVIIGIDFAEEVDLFAAVAFELVPDEENGGYRYVQIFLDYFNGIDTAELDDYCTELVDTYPTVTKVRIDRTGAGTGLTAFMKRRYGSTLIEGINFAASMVLDNKKEKKESIRKFMCVNLKDMIEHERVSLLNDEMQIAHLGAIDYSLKVTRDKDKGHGDIFFALALALLPSIYSYRRPQTAVSAPKKDGEEKRLDYTNIPIQERLDMYKRRAFK